MLVSSSDAVPLDVVVVVEEEEAFRGLTDAAARAAAAWRPESARALLS